MGTGALLGLLQGLFEWLPVSSQGAVTAVANLVFNRDVDEAIALGLWLHIGTAAAAAVAFRGDLFDLVREVFQNRRVTTGRIGFYMVATLVSGAAGLPLLLALGEVSSRSGAMVMAILGFSMLLTSVVVRRIPQNGTRSASDVRLSDGVLVGLAQGLAVIPGLSRSGLTVAMLLGRRIERQAALRLSFILSIPASLGAAFVAGVDSALLTSTEGLVGAAVAFVVGLASIRLLLAVARKVDLSAFIFIVGSTILAGGVWQALV